MALTSLAPAVVRSRKILAEKSAEVALKLVPEPTEGKQADRRYFAVFVTLVGVIGLVFLLFINTLLAQDAFKLSELKAEAKLVSDQREAIARTIDEISSPEALAQKAAELGMKPSKVPNFLDLTPSLEKAVVKNG
ncbi:MAG: hypothetical protein RL144_1108 [Actinomycetota bacterium]|jgi:hypothetical protein